MTRHRHSGTAMGVHADTLRKYKAMNEAIALAERTRRNTLNMGNEDNNNECDTPAEVDALIAGKHSAIDTPIEVERYLKQRRGLANAERDAVDTPIEAGIAQKEKYRLIDPKIQAEKKAEEVPEPRSKFTP